MRMRSLQNAFSQQDDPTSVFNEHKDNFSAKSIAFWLIKCHWGVKGVFCKRHLLSNQRKLWYTLRVV